MGDSRPPYTANEVASFNAYQACGEYHEYHEYTCGNEHEGDRVLVAERGGLTCPTCGYVQDWCLSNATDWKWMDGGRLWI